MKAIFRLFVFVLLLGGWTLAALSLHVIRTPDQIPITLLTKEKLSFSETWVDTTKWTRQDVGRHPAVIERLLRTQQADVLKHVLDEGDGSLEGQLINELVRATPPGERPAQAMLLQETLTKRWFRWPWESRG